jgi:hypothetical protein
MESGCTSTGDHSSSYHDAYGSHAYRFKIAIANTSKQIKEEYSRLVWYRLKCSS